MFYRNALPKKLDIDKKPAAAPTKPVAPPVEPPKQVVPVVEPVKVEVPKAEASVAEPVVEVNTELIQETPKTKKTNNKKGE